MSLLQKLTTGKTPAPPRVLIYSDPGVGKSSFAATAPKPVFIPLEDGLDQISCTKFPHVKDFATLIADLKAVLNEEHDFQTLVIDSLSALQNVVSDGVCAAAGAKFLTAAYGGYNRGPDAALVQFRKDVYSLLDEIRQKRNMCIIQIAHSHDETVKYTDGSTDRRTAPRLIAAIRDWVVEWNDIVAYAKIRTMEDASGGKIVIGKNGGDREMYCVGDTRLLAKNRYGIPAGALPFTWDAIREAIARAKASDAPAQEASATQPAATGDIEK